MLCATCGTVNASGAKFCTQCGLALEAATGRPEVARSGQLAPEALLAGRYLILRKLADGGFSAVYYAHDTRLGNQAVVVKEMAVGAYGSDREAVDRAVAAFRQEAELLARISHPNLPRVIDRFEQAGRQFLVMDYVLGSNLQTIREATPGPLPEAEVLGWAAQLCDVLQFLHAQQPPIIYRDLKPDNVMLQPNGSIKLIDFGIARFYKQGKTSDTAAFGTPGYAPPEQYGKGQSDARTDIYTLGALLYTLLTGYDIASTPFRFPPARRVNPHISTRTEAALARATLPDPDQRFSTIAEFRHALGLKTSSGSLGNAPGTPAAHEDRPRPASNRLFFTRYAPPALAVLLGLGALIVFWVPRPKTPPLGTSSPGSAATSNQAGMVIGSGATPTRSDGPPTLPATPAYTAILPTPVLAAPSAAPPTPPIPAGRLVYQDDFSADTSASGVENVSGLEDEKGSADFSRGIHAPGVYHFKLANPSDARWEVLPRLAVGSFSLQIELWDNSDAFIGSVEQGVIFRVRDDTHFYALLLNPRTGQYRVRKLDGKEHWSDLITQKASPQIKRKGEHNQLRVDGSGDTFTIYLNDTFLDRFSDSAYRFGMLGMIVNNLDASQPHMHFDNLHIWSSDAPAPVPSLDPVRKQAAGNMVLIPGSEFIMGSNEKSDEHAHLVALPNFYIDRTEVTNAAYRQCIAAGKCGRQPASSETHPSYALQPEFNTFPVIHVSWQQANQFCAWAGKRLPTEAEWEKAASWNGATGTKVIWPSGNAFNPATLNSIESLIGDTTSVDRLAEEVNHTLGMTANAYEWTSSLYMTYPYNARDGREDLQAAGDRVFRGGSWAQTSGKARSVSRQAAAPKYEDREIGFRCAASP